MSFKCKEKYNKVVLKKEVCGKNFKVLNKSISVEARNFTKSMSHKGGSS